MAFQTKEGKSYGSRFVAKRKDKEHDQSSMMNTPEKPASDGAALLGAAKPEAEQNPALNPALNPEQKPEEQAKPVEDPKQVVAQHGKANTVHIAHDHKF